LLRKSYPDDGLGHLDHYLHFSFRFQFLIRKCCVTTSTPIQFPRFLFFFIVVRFVVCYCFDLLDRL
jgi:hypothetical protein